MPTTRWHLRPAAPGDEPVLRALRLRALSEAPEAFGSTLERELARTTADWQRWMSPGVTFILESVGQPQGLVAGMRDEMDPAIVHLRAMWVDPSLRGSGAADELVTRVFDWAAAEGARTVRLDVFEDNPRARRFYERLGFRETGEQTIQERDGRVELWLERPIQ